MKTSPTERIPLVAAVVANLAIFGSVGCAAFLVSVAPDLYHRSVQEDEILEWITFWNFVGAAWLLTATAVRRIRKRDSWPWFLVGLAAFCLLVALEEISWGQRIFGYRPTAYFLATNYQQEANLHNALGDTVRQYGFLAVCWGYGVLLPIAGAWPVTRGLLDRVGVSVPPLEFLPAFAVTAVFYQVYPWSHSGEWAEAMLGYGFLFVAVVERGRLRHMAGSGGGGNAEPGFARRFGVAWLVTALLGAGTARAEWLWTADDPERLARAQIELAALQQDIAAARTRTKCGLHKRIFTMARAYGMDHLFDGAFASLQKSGLPEDRASYFIDPWNSAYWVRHVCSADRRRRAIFVYSFGPDRQRDSTPWQIIEDDLGAWISRPRSATGD